MRKIEPHRFIRVQTRPEAVEGNEECAEDAEHSECLCDEDVLEREIMPPGEDGGQPGDGTC